MWRSVRGEPALATALAAGVALGAAGHAGMALAAGMLLGGLDGARAGWGGITPLEAAQFGAFSAFVKGGGLVASAGATAGLAGRTAALVRRQALAALWRERDGGGPPALARVTLRTREVELAVAGVIPGLGAGVQVAVLAGTLIAVSGALALVTLGALAPLALGLAWLRRGLRGRSAAAQDRAQRLLEDLDGLLGHVDLWRVQGARAALDRALEETSRRAERAAVAWERARVGLSSLNEALAAAAILAVIAWAPALGLPLTDPRVATSLGLALLAYRPLRDLGEARGWALRGANAVEALAAWGASAEPSPPEVGAARDRPWPLQALRLSAFAPARRVAAQGERAGARAAAGRPLDALIPAGALVALVGPTGAGKTSLLRALLGLDAAEGSLRYGDEELVRAAVGPAARPFGWVPQEAHLLPGTLTENVLVGAEGGAAAARSALELVGAAHLLDELGDQPLGAGRRGLSGGQRRLVALARALAGGAPVLLLDEPTEGLDARTEQRVLARLGALRGRRTVIVATHRPSLVAAADAVLTVSELGEEPRVVLEQEADVGDAVPEHGEPLDADAEREA